VKSIFLRLLLLAGVFYFQGCAPAVWHQFVANVQRPAEPTQFFQQLDLAVASAGVRDASSFPVPGFPYLRSNRFLTGLKDGLQSDAQYNQWILWLQQLGQHAREKEIQNLPADALRDCAARLGEAPDRRTLLKRSLSHSNQLLAHDKAQPGYFTAVRAAVKNPDEYSIAMRVAGVYPLASLPVAVVTHRVQDKFSRWHATPLSRLGTLGELTAYAPPDGPAFSESSVRLILNRCRQNALGVPMPSSADGNALLSMFAPVIVQDVGGDYDQIGEVVWKDKHLSVNPQNPTVYYYFSHARLKGEPVLQINYVFWFAARDGPNSPWYERGTLDGLTVRISLDGEGRPFMVDIMNNCGCYHFFVPERKKVKRVMPRPQEIDAFVPRWLPQRFPQGRLNLRINSGWHQVENIATDMSTPHHRIYRPVPYECLESLRRDEDTFESIFNARGIAKKSGRIEPLVFFPMGIPDVGSMRQRGHHAVKLIGRAYFDDPALFNQNFEFE
jgi:hypothetical protein